MEEAEPEEEFNEAEAAAAEEQRAMQAAAAAAGATFVDTASAQQHTEPAGQPACSAWVGSYCGHDSVSCHLLAPES